MYIFINLTCSILLLLTTTQSLTSQNVTSSTSSSSKVVAVEGGILPETAVLTTLDDRLDRTHLGREHVEDGKIITNANNTGAVNISAKSTLTKFNNTVKPATATISKLDEMDLGVPKKNDEKPSVGKKGVSYSDIDVDDDLVKEHALKINATGISTTPKPVSTTKVIIPKKPLITEHDDFATTNAESKAEPNPKIPSIDTLLENKTKRSDYVIPIVAVILSVPLVAIIISVVYKRGADWWQHRNYRRMDFLIEGMYNN